MLWRGDRRSNDPAELSTDRAHIPRFCTLQGTTEKSKSEQLKQR